jgi:hypothetical protein
VLGVGGFGGVTFGVELLGAGVFEEEPFEGEFAFDALVESALGAAEFAEVGFEGWFEDGCNSLTVLSTVPDLGLSASAGAAAGVRGGAVQLGASSGIKGAVAGAAAGTAWSAQNATVEPNNAKARPPASAQQPARDARTVDASTGKESIEFGPAFSDAL